MHHPPPPPQPVVPYAPYVDARDADHLRLLSIFHYVYGGLVALFSCLFILYIVIGVVFVSGSATFPTPAPTTTAPTTAPVGPPSQAFGWMFVVMGSVMLLVGWTIAGLTIASGRCMARRRARTFSLVVAGVNCLSVPLGTTLGVFTFIVLLRESVAAQYASAGPDSARGV
jgi:hypothetical protein